MDTLNEALKAYQTLLRKDYCLKLGTVSQEVMQIVFFFLPEHFIHLSGICKLADLADIANTRSKKNLYQRLMSGDISYTYLQSSSFFSEINQRLNDLILLPGLLENLRSGKVIIRFNPAIAGTRINADFLIYKKEIELIYHLFLKEHGGSRFVPISFFSRSSPKFLMRQTKLRILDVKVVDRS